jgi:N-acetyl-anhydromuramyl-L-alanine amidase AmpD
MGTTQIKEWQRRIGVTEDGIFGQVTLETSLDIWDVAYPEIEPTPPIPPPTPKPSGDNPYSVKKNILYKGSDPVSYKASPNHGGEIVPELIVIHYTGDNGTGGLQWLCDSDSGVSAHLWISKAGVVWQLLPLNVRGWHAGGSSWKGEAEGNSVNGFSIGIENQGIGDSWPEAQVIANKQVIEALMKAYPIITDVAGHEDVAPGRKVDPGPRYPWSKVWPNHV